MYGENRLFDQGISGSIANEDDSTLLRFAPQRPFRSVSVEYQKY